MATLAKAQKQDAAAIAGAIALHGLLMLGLYYAAKNAEPPPLPKPKVIEVSIAEEIGPETTSLNEDSLASVAPELGSPAPPEVSEPLPVPVPAPTPRALPQPAPRPTPRPVPRPSPPAVAKATPKPAPKPATRPAQRQAAATPSQRPAQRPGGTRLGNNFLDGVGTKASGPAGAKPATGGPTAAEARRSIDVSIKNKVAPYWQRNVPSGVDVNKLRVTLRFRLNRDGSLAGSPSVVGALEGKTASNEPQQALFIERAKKALQQAAPFKLPADYYDQWKTWDLTFSIGRVT